MVIIRRKDPPAYEGAKTFWITVGHRETFVEADALIKTLKRFSKSGTAFWRGEEKEFDSSQ